MTKASSACVMLASGIFLFPACSGTADPADELGSSGAAGRTLSSDTGTGGTSAGFGGGGASNTSGVGGASSVPADPPPPPCNDLLLDAPPYVLTSAPGAAPAPTGGSIVDGTYFVTGATMYGQSFPDLPFGRHKVQISGASWQDAEGESEPDGVNPDRYSTFSLTSAGTSLTLSRSCPAGSETMNLTYSAEEGRLTVFVLDRGVTFANVFTRQ
jgi:hypothetical protein